MIRWHARLLMCIPFLLAGPVRGLAQEVVGGKKVTIKIEWEQTETRKKRYVIQYEKGIPQEAVSRVATELEDIFEVLSKTFGFTPGDKLQVKFLDTPNTYEQEGGDPSHPAHYNSRTRSLVLRQMPYYRLIPTVYHEAFHQFLHEYIGDGVPIPIWFNEGMAVYFEGIQREPNKREPKLDPNLINFRRIRMVKDAIFTRSAIPLATLIDVTPEEFHNKDKEALHYSQSFAVVYFLMKASRGRLLTTYARELKRTKDPEAANAKLFGKDRKNLPKVEASWKTFTLQLEIPDQ